MPTPNVKKKNWETAANLKTLADYTAILFHRHSCTRVAAREMAVLEQDTPLYQELLKNNQELFRTGDICFKP